MRRWSVSHSLHRPKDGQSPQYRRNRHRNSRPPAFVDGSIGHPTLSSLHEAIGYQFPEQIADLVLQKHEDARLHVLAPIVQDRKGEYRKELAQALAARIDGEIIELDGQISLARYEKHTIELVVDRIKARPDRKERLVEARRSLALADGQMSMLIQLPGHQPEHRVFSALGLVLNTEFPSLNWSHASFPSMPRKERVPRAMGLDGWRTSTFHSLTPSACTDGRATTHRRSTAVTSVPAPSCVRS